MIVLIRGNTLITTLLISGVLSALVLNLMSQIHLEMKSLNMFHDHMKERYAVQKAFQSIENAIETKTVCLTGKTCTIHAAGFKFDYRLTLNSVQCCLKMLIKQRIKSSQFYKVDLILKEKNHHYRGQFALPMDLSIKLCK